MKKKGRVKIQYRFDRAQVLSYVLSYAGRVDVRSSETPVSFIRVEMARSWRRKRQILQPRAT